MKMKALSGLLGAFLAGPAGAAVYTLYDGNQATAPGAQGWTAVLFGASQTVGASGTSLSTMAFGSLQAGYSRQGSQLPLQLDSSGSGFHLLFDAQLLSESHASSDRAGFSLIVLDSRHQGVEIGFWNSSLWAQQVGFSHGESVSFDNLGGINHYDLLLAGGHYSLSASRAGQSTVSLSGSLRDYGAPSLPYALSNFIFFGDDTTSAKASFRLDQVSVVSVAEPALPVLLLLASGLGFGFNARRRTSEI